MTNNQYGAVFTDYGDTHFSKNGKVFAFAQGSTTSPEILVYELINGSWTNITSNLTQNPVKDQLQADANENQFHRIALSEDGHTIVISSYRTSAGQFGDGGTDGGRMFAFRYNGSTWDQLGNAGSLKPPFAVKTRNYTGSSLAISDDGNRIVASGKYRGGAIFCLGLGWY